MKIAIDGPAGSGKSTVAKLLSKELDFEYIDTGAMYRACALYLKNSNFNFATLGIEDNIEELKNVEISFKDKHVQLNGKDVEGEIRVNEISSLASKIAENFYVREFLVKEQRAISEKIENIILDGRDIGTNVLPDADYKFYIDASSAVRGQRRFLELKEKGENIPLETLIEEIEIRDKRDKERKFAPLIQSLDAVYILTDNLNVKEVLNKIKSLIKDK